MILKSTCGFVLTIEIKYNFLPTNDSTALSFSFKHFYMLAVFIDMNNVFYLLLSIDWISFHYWKLLCFKHGLNVTFSTVLFPRLK